LYRPSAPHLALSHRCPTAPGPSRSRRGPQFFASVRDLSATSDKVPNGRGRSHDANRASRNFDFEPAHIQAMHRAFDAVCVKLQLSMASEDKLTELVEEKVIELAAAGDRNMETLTARVLAEFGFENDGSLWRH
jgi:hypothetical protein